MFVISRVRLVKNLLNITTSCQNRCPLRDTKRFLSNKTDFNSRCGNHVQLYYILMYVKTYFKRSTCDFRNGKCCLPASHVSVRGSRPEMSGCLAKRWMTGAQRKWFRSLFQILNQPLLQATTADINSDMCDFLLPAQTMIIWSAGAVAQSPQRHREEELVVGLNESIDHNRNKCFHWVSFSIQTHVLLHDWMLHMSTLHMDNGSSDKPSDKCEQQFSSLEHRLSALHSVYIVVLCWFSLTALTDTLFYWLTEMLATCYAYTKAWR